MGSIQGGGGSCGRGLAEGKRVRLDASIKIAEVWQSNCISCLC